MLKLPQKFFATSDDCCSTPDPGCLPVCNSRFLTLATADTLQIFGLPPGGQCMGKLTSADKGFVVSLGAGNGHAILETPNWPITDQGADGDDVPNPWPYLIGMVGSGDAVNWRQIHAPATGSYRVESEDGNFKLVDATNIPGISGVCEAATTVAMVQMFGCYSTDLTVEEPEYFLKKLSTPADRPLVGFEDVNGNEWVRALPEDQYFTHPLAEFGELRVTTLIQLDNAGDPIAGGIEVLDRTAVADAVLGYYSPGNQKFYRSPAHVRDVETQTASQAVVLGGAYVTITGHLQPGSLTFNHPNVRVSWSAMFEDAENSDFGLYMDGALQFEWRFADTASPAAQLSFSGSTILTGLAIGNHTFDIRVKGTSGAAVVNWSSMAVETLSD